MPLLKFVPAISYCAVLSSLRPFVLIRVTTCICFLSWFLSCFETTHEIVKTYFAELFVSVQVIRHLVRCYQSPSNAFATISVKVWKLWVMINPKQRLKTYLSSCTRIIANYRNCIVLSGMTECCHKFWRLVSEVLNILFTSLPAWLPPSGDKTQRRTKKGKRKPYIMRNRKGGLQKWNGRREPYTVDRVRMFDRLA